MNAVSENLLSVKKLCVDFCARGKPARVVDEVSFELARGEILAIVGESGSGKSVTSQALAGLLPAAPACLLSGSVHLAGREVLGLPERELRAIRGKDIAYVFQDPLSSLNPIYTIGWQIREAIRTHVPAKKEEVNARVREVLQAVGIAPGLENAFPHEFSGGMQQRVMIAMALACEPKILVADEPTTALDVTIQKQIMELLLSVREQFGMSIILITHNFGIVSQVADRVCVMFRGKIVESGLAQAVIKNPQHPYTKALLACVPQLGSNTRRLVAIENA